MSKRVYSVKTDKSGLNLRAEPSLEAEILRVIPNGERVTLDAEVEAPDGWAAVKGGGFVMTDYLE